MQAPLLDQFTLSNKIVIYPKISLKLLFEFPYCCLLVVRFPYDYVLRAASDRPTAFPASSSYNHNLLRFCVQFSRYNVFPFQEMVGQSGLEPPTSRLSVVCSSQLSYWPIVSRSFVPFASAVSLSRFVQSSVSPLCFLSHSKHALNGA